jgi:hypothetical protein
MVDDAAKGHDEIPFLPLDCFWLEAVLYWGA